MSATKTFAARLAWVTRLPEANDIRRHLGRAAELDAEIAAEKERHRKRLAEMRAEARANEREAETDAARDWTGTEITAAKAEPAASSTAPAEFHAAPTPRAASPPTERTTTATACEARRGATWMRRHLEDRRALLRELLGEPREDAYPGTIDTRVAFGELCAVNWMLGLLDPSPTVRRAEEAIEFPR